MPATLTPQQVAALAQIIHEVFDVQTNQLLVEKNPPSIPGEADVDYRIYVPEGEGTRLVCEWISDWPFPGEA